MVIAIIAILASMLLPVLSQARSHAHKTQCLNNVKQLFTACLLYSDSNAEYLPQIRVGSDGMSWSHRLLAGGFLPENKGSLNCPQPNTFAPASPQISYGRNGCGADGGQMLDNSYPGDLLKRYVQPSGKILLGDATHVHMLEWGVWQWSSVLRKKEYAPDARHALQANFAFADGHAASISYREKNEGLFDPATINPIWRR